MVPTRSLFRIAHRLRALAGSLGLATGAVVLTLVGLELAFRVAGVSVGTVQINRETVRRSDNPRLLFELRPRSRVQAEVVYAINALGLRGPETTVEKPLDVRRVAVLGDSIAFGYWVAEHDAFPRQLEALLSESVTGARTEVLDFGVPGYNLDQEIETLRRRVLAFSPDVVVVAFCLNDLEGLFSYELGLVQDRSVRSRSMPGRLREALLRRSLLFSWVEYRLSELAARRRFVKTTNPLSGPLYAEALSQQKTALEARFSLLHAVLQSRGIPGLVVVFPTLGRRLDRYPYRELHRAVAETAQGAGLAVLDLLDCYAGYDFRELRVDVVHPSPLGHRVAAHAIRDALCARGWLCTGAVAAAPGCRDYRAADFPQVRGY
jgi:lysophospholipase L1-like esterase